MAKNDIQVAHIAALVGADPNKSAVPDEACSEPLLAQDVPALRGQ
jgi:hypothetical protein